jgi:hypothetical protein
VASVALPARPLLWVAFQRCVLVSSWRRYFAFSFVVEEQLDQQGRYIFAGMPLWLRLWLCGGFLHHMHASARVAGKLFQTTHVGRPT